MEGALFLSYQHDHENEELNLSFCARENGISFSFSMEHWKAIRSLFRRAWQAPEVVSAWETLALEYGAL